MYTQSLRDALPSDVAVGVPPGERGEHLHGNGVVCSSFGSIWENISGYRFGGVFGPTKE